MEYAIEKGYLYKIPHEGRICTFQYIAFRGTYGNLIELIDKENLKRPNSAETASLIHYSFQGSYEKPKSEIQSILYHAMFWESTGNLLIPKSNEEINNGVILQDNPLIIKGELVMNKQDLIQRLSDAEEFSVKGHPIFISKDRSVRFVPFGFKTEEQTFNELAINPYIVGRYLGRKNSELEHSEQIAEIASKCKENPSLFGFYSLDQTKSGLSLIWSYSNILNISLPLSITPPDSFEKDPHFGGHSFGIKQ